MRRMCGHSDHEIARCKSASIRVQLGVDMAKVYQVIGSTEDGTTIVLDAPLPVRGRLKMQVEPVPLAEAPTVARMREVLAAIHERQRARGHKPPTAEEVDDYIKQLRSEWRDETNLP